MPNRLIKETICTSQNLNELTPEEEIFFYRLIVNCDDYGRMDARLAILRARCFPLRTDNIKENQVLKWLQSLVTHNLIDIYEVNGGRYIQFRTWENHQQIRAKRSKYPDPNGNLISVDSIGNQVISSANNSPRNPIQSNPIQSESNPNPIRIHIYPQFKNIKISEEEHQKLIDLFGKAGTKERVENLSLYIASKGDKYKNHYATILNWERRDEKNKPAAGAKQLPDTKKLKEEWEQ